MDISAALMHAAADEDIYVKNTPKLCTIDWKPQSTGHEKRVHSGKTFQLET